MAQWPTAAEAYNRKSTTGSAQGDWVFQGQLNKSAFVFVRDNGNELAMPQTEREAQQAQQRVTKPLFRILDGVNGIAS